jgi:hypothetical protein
MPSFCRKLLSELSRGGAPQLFVWNSRRSALCSSKQHTLFSLKQHSIAILNFSNSWVYAYCVQASHCRYNVNLPSLPTVSLPGQTCLLWHWSVGGAFFVSRLRPLTAVYGCGVTPGDSLQFIAVVQCNSLPLFLRVTGAHQTSICNSLATSVGIVTSCKSYGT